MVNQLLNNKQNNKIFIKYIFSSILSTLGYSCYVLVDTIFLAMVDDNAIAALNIVLPAYQTVLALASMVAIGSSTLFAIKKAQGNIEEASSYFSIALKISIPFSIIVTILLIFFRRPLLIALGANNETLQLAIEYLIGYVSLLPFNILSTILLAFIRCDNAPKLAGTAALIGSLSNVVLDAFFVLVVKWGMFGAAFATSLSPIISIAICMIHFMKKTNTFSYHNIKISITKIKEIFKLGFPTFIAGIASSFTMLIFNKQLLNLGGNMALTAYGIIVNISVIFTCIITGITSGVGPLYSECYGKMDYESLKYYVKLTIYSICTAFLISYFVMLIKPYLLINLFNPSNNIELSKLTKKAAFIYLLGYLFNGYSQFVNVYFVSVEFPKPSSIISILEAGIVITPVVLILPKIFDLNGVWLSYPVSQLIILMVAIYLFKKYKIK